MVHWAAGRGKRQQGGHLMVRSNGLIVAINAGPASTSSPVGSHSGSRSALPLPLVLAPSARRAPDPDSDAASAAAAEAAVLLPASRCSNPPNLCLHRGSTIRGPDVRPNAVACGAGSTRQHAGPAEVKEWSAPPGAAGNRAKKCIRRGMRHPMCCTPHVLQPGLGRAHKAQCAAVKCCPARSPQRPCQPTHLSLDSISGMAL